MPTKAGLIDRLTPLIDSTTLDREIRRTEKETKQREETLRLGHINVVENKLLVSAVTDLRSTLEGLRKDNKKQEPETLFGKLFGDQFGGLKELTSGAGILRKAGQLSGSSVIGTITSHFADKLDNNSEKTREKARFVSVSMEGTAGGRKLKDRFGIKGAAKILGEKYEERKQLEAKIAGIEEQQRLMQNADVPDADLPPDLLEHLDQLKADLQKNSNFFAKGNVVIRDGKYAGIKRAAPKPKAILRDKPSEPRPERDLKDFSGDELRQTFLSGVVDGIREEFQTLSKKEQDALKKDTSALRDLISSIVGISDELGATSDADIKKAVQALIDEGTEKEQLTELKKISRVLVENQKKGREDEIEKPRLQEVFDQVKEKPKSEGFFDTIKSVFGGFFGTGSIFGKTVGVLTSALKGGVGIFARIIPALGAILAPIGSALGALLPLLGPGAAVTGAGLLGYNVGKFLNEKVLNPAMEAITGTEGGTTGTALYGLVDKVSGWFGNSDADKMEKAEADQGIKRLEEGKKITQETADLIKKTQNVDVPREKIIRPRAPEPSASIATSTVENISRDIERTEKIVRQGTIVQNTPQTNVVNNNSSVTQVYNKPIRNSDPTWNSAMSLKMVY